MTSIAVWAGVDSRGVSSLYVASDSRITWPSGSWDQGRKVFACASKPHIFGYVGDVLFPALALPVLVDRIDRGLLASGDQNWCDGVNQAVRRLWRDYPVNERRDFSIIYGFRSGTNMDSKFGLAILAYTKYGESWTSEHIPMPEHSKLLLSKGSGSEAVRNSYALWQQSNSAGTSRAVFSAFCESIASREDPKTGGAPQLAGLYREGSGRLFGIVHAGQRYFAGAALTGAEQPQGVDWRNSLFERVDGTRKKRLPSAQEHESR